ncbi:MAG: hypothetical protein NTY53_01940, partial [Kiritimatiellaeota bacterium]|nr:hypothetical protein [Kiritimatiellota bacterium]
QYSHVSLWCLWSSPMIIGTPIERLDEFTLGLLTNDEVLEINQDPLGKQAVRTLLAGGGEALLKELEDGSKALGLFNIGAAEAEISVKWSELGLRGPQRVRDLWRQQDRGEFAEGYSAKIAPHGVLLLRLRRATIPVHGEKFFAIMVERDLRARSNALGDRVPPSPDPAV